MKRSGFIFAALLALSFSAVASPIAGRVGPHGHALPTWVRVVDWDGEIIDLALFSVTAITLCPTRGDADIWSYEASAGSAVIETVAGVLQLQYADKQYNDGRVTGNPNTTGDQLLLIEQPGAIFGNGAESCTTFGRSAS